MDNQKKGLAGFTIAILSVALISITLVNIEQFNITIPIGNSKSKNKVAESTVLPEESDIPESTDVTKTEENQTEAPSTNNSSTKPPEQYVATEASPTISPTKIPNLTRGETGSEKKITKSELESYRYTNDADSSTSDSDADVQSDGDSTGNSNNTESSGIDNQEKTINIEKSSKLIMMADSEQIANNNSSLTVRRNRKAINNTTMETDEEILSTEDPDVLSDADEDMGENSDMQEDQTFSISNICNVNSLEINDYTNLVYIYIQPGEYTITINDSSVLFDYYIVPDISPLFSDAGMVPSDGNTDENQPDETEYEDQSSEE